VVSGVVILVAFVLYERRQAHPLIDLSLFKDRLFRSTTSVMVLGATAFLGTLYLVALFFQNALGMTALRAGLTIFPEALGVMLGSQVVSRALYPRFGPRRLMMGGLLAIAVSMLILTQITPATNEWMIRLDMALLGYGMAHVFLPSQAASFTTIGMERTGGASAIYNATRQLGGAVGVALLTAVLAEGPAHRIGTTSIPTLTAYHYGFAAAAFVALLAIPAALLVSDAAAAPTMVRRVRPTPARPVEPAPVIPEPVPVAD
jgi:MFS family permease